MLPEPDLFSSVKNHKSNSYSQSVTSEETNLVVDASVNYAHPDKTVENEAEVCESDRSYLKRCHPYTVGVATVISKGISSSNSSADSKGPQERRVRWWYLTVIVLLYIGLITSFCLNVNLLLKSFSEPSSAEISISQHQLGLDEADLSRGKYIYQ